MDYLSEYLTLLEEAQASPSASSELTGTWHPFSKGTTKAALSADRSQLQRVAKGLNVLGAQPAATRLRTGNRLLFNSARGPHGVKARSCIMQCIASLEMARRKEMENQGMLQPAEDHQCRNQQRQQQQQQQEEEQQEQPVHQQQVHNVEQMHKGQQVHGCEGGQTSRGQPMGTGRSRLIRRDDSAGRSSGPQELQAKRQRLVGSLEETAQDASARLHTALGDLSSLQEQFILRSETLRQEVEAHLAERARLFKQIDAMEKEGNAIQLLKPRVYDLYDEYAAIMAWDNL